MKYRIVESVEKKENINHPVDDNFTLSEELLNIKSEKINESAESDRDKDSNYNCCGINIDLEEFKDAIEQCYKCLCKNDDTVSDGAYGDFTTSELCKGFDECMENDLAIKELAQKFTEYSGISLSSDREKASFIYEVDELYGPDIWDAIDNCNVNESLEEDYEYSEYDKKLLVNRAKSIAKAIYDLYNSDQVEAQGELPSAKEIAEDLLKEPKKIDMYAKFLSKIAGTKKVKNYTEKLIQELASFKKKLSLMKPQTSECLMKVRDIKEGKEIDRQVFASLEKLNDGGYSILNDGYFVARVSADDDDDAKAVFKKFLNSDWKKAWKDGTLPKYANDWIDGKVDESLKENCSGGNCDETEKMSNEELEKYLSKLIKEYRAKKAELKNESLSRRQNDEKTATKEDIHKNNRKEIIDKHRKNKQESFKRVPKRSINESKVSNKRNNNG